MADEQGVPAEKSPEELRAMFAAIEESMRHTKVFGGDLEMPVTVKSIRIQSSRARTKPAPGSWVSVRLSRPAATYVGLYLGELPRPDSIVSFRSDIAELTVTANLNPAMWVPALGRIVWGCESWWGQIKDPEQLRQITDADIAAQPCVRILNGLIAEQAAKAAEEASRGQVDGG